MSDERLPMNPYASPRVRDADAAESQQQPPSPPANHVAKSNIVGLVLTVLVAAAVGLARPQFSKLFHDFKIDLPAMTICLMSNWFFYGAIVLFLAWFLVGILTSRRKVSAAIGAVGIGGLLLAGLYAVVALFLPLIMIVNRLGA